MRNSVDLPAPFSPTSARTSPGADRERHVIERADHAETLRDAERGQSRRRLLRASVAALASIAGIAARRFATPLRRAYLWHSLSLYRAKLSAVIRSALT